MRLIGTSVSLTGETLLSASLTFSPGLRTFLMPLLPLKTLGFLLAVSLQPLPFPFLLLGFRVLDPLSFSLCLARSALVLLPLRSCLLPLNLSVHLLSPPLLSGRLALETFLPDFGLLVCSLLVLCLGLLALALPFALFLVLALFHPTRWRLAHRVHLLGPCLGDQPSGRQ